MKESLRILQQIVNAPELRQALAQIPVSEQRSVLDTYCSCACSRAESYPPLKPKFVHMAGLPGSGKSTFARQLQEKSATEKWVLISFDTIMEGLSGYKSIGDSKLSFAQWELPARALGYVLLSTCLAQGLSVLLDHSAADPRHLALMQALKAEQAYALAMYYVEAAPEKVLPLIEKREMVTQRHTPPELVYSRQLLLEALLPEYRQCVDTFEVCCW